MSEYQKGDMVELKKWRRGPNFKNGKERNSAVDERKRRKEVCKGY